MMLLRYCCITCFRRRLCKLNFPLFCSVPLIYCCTFYVVFFPSDDHHDSIIVVKMNSKSIFFSLSPFFVIGPKWKERVENENIFLKSSKEPFLKHQTVDVLCHDALSPISIHSFINRRIKLISAHTSHSHSRTHTVRHMNSSNFLLRLLRTMAKRLTIGIPIKTSLSHTHLSYCARFLCYSLAFGYFLHCGLY